MNLDLKDLVVFGGNWDLISVSFHATVHMPLLHLWACVGILREFNYMRFLLFVKI